MTTRADERHDRRQAHLPAVVFAAVLLAAVMVACGGAATRPTAEPSPPTPAAGTEASPSEAARISPSPSDETSPTLADEAQPARVRIPTVDIDSELIQLGLDDQGQLEVPSGPDYDTAGWFIHGPRPGELGPAVVAGHVDSKRGPSVFFRLGEVSVGDPATVTYDDGSTATFEVTVVEQHRKTEFPTERVYGDTDQAEIRLITCGGWFDGSVGHYEDNVIVFGELVELSTS